MIYWLFVDPGPMADMIPGTNVFRYISFRTLWCVITALAVSYYFFPPFIERMKRSNVDQIIREDGPESHLLQKVGTPTMGGVCLIFSILVAALLWARLDVASTWMTLAIMVGYGAIGFVDDWKKVREKSSAGLSGRYKILGQLAIGGAVLAYGYTTGVFDASVNLPFLKGHAIDFAHLSASAPSWLGWLYVVFALFILVGTSNAVNLTDGLDGLAIGPTMTCASTYAVLAYLAGNTRFAEYLGIVYVPGAGELAVVALAVVGAGLGFLWYNAYPAQIFMGDVGSLALGGTLGILAILTRHEILLAVVGGVFVMEALSVIIQVTSYKLTGRRVFAMAPIHHHYEKQGWSEPKIIVRFWIISIILSLVALSTLKLR
jgi:phospho-N-acetylmuramoyl-pentapeptide-transferase